MFFSSLFKALPLCGMLLAPFALQAIGSTSTSTSTSTPTYTVIEDRANHPLLSPTFSERNVLKIQLANGLQAYLVSDPKTDKSAAVLSVQVGSWDNPPEFPGLAHFLEHLLFLGTKKYPNEAEYHRFILEHGGIANAYTDSDHTSYMFSIDNNAFEQGLDRFASFFKEPLFNPSGVSRELQAVDQEHSKNLINDNWRLYYIQKELASKKHPYHQFYSGNRATLSKVDQEFLKKWYQEHYSANLMHLAVHSNLPMQTLRDLVVSEFQDIPNHDQKAFSIDTPIATNASEGKMIYVESLKDKRTLHLIWDLSAEFAHMRNSKPEQVIGYVLAHEGEESLLAQLKREQLANGIQFSGFQIGSNNLQIDLDIELTDLGVKQVDQVISLVFQTISMLKQTVFPQYLFDEIKKMAILNYQYQPREDLFSHVQMEGSWLVHEDLSSYPEQTLIIQEFDPKAIQELLSLLTPEKTQYYLVAPDSLTGVKPDQHEPWLGGNYAVKAIDQSQLKSWSELKPNPQIELPKPNELIPRNLFLIEKEEELMGESFSMPNPELVLNNEQGVVYFASDTYYLVPQVSWIFQIKTPFIEIGNANKTVLADLYLKSLKSELSRYSYLATLAGLDYQLTRKENGIEISINGYSNNAHLLFEKISKQLKDVHPTAVEFENYKDALLRGYQDSCKCMPFEQASEVLKNILFKKYASEKQKAAAIKKITFENFKTYCKKLFSQVYLEGVFFGNIEKQQAKQLVDDLLNTLKAPFYPKEKQIKAQIIVLPSTEGPFYWKQSIETPGNAVILAIEHGPFSFKMRTAQQLLMQAMKESFFSTLRTKQQTGYIVKSAAEEIESQLFNLFIVQSNTHDVRDLLSRFELFIEGYLQELSKEEIPEERFHALKNSQLKILEQPPKNLKEMAELLNALAFRFEGDFDRIKHRIAATKALIYPEFLQISQDFMGRQNKKRIAILLEGTFVEQSIMQYTPLKNLEKLRKMSDYISYSKSLTTENKEDKK